MKTTAIAVLVSTISLLAACSTTGEPGKEAPQISAEQRETKPAQPAAVPDAGTSGRTAMQLPVAGRDADPLEELRRLRYSVFFDFDSNVVRSGEQPVVDSHGRHLAESSKVKTMITGNADERGSREYNLALGQRRAEAVKKALKALGVREEQMEAVSYGEEKPFAHGHDETAWAQNRRADILYPR